MTHKNWTRLETPEGQIELRVSGPTWQVLLRRGKSDQWKLSCEGNWSGTATTEIPEAAEDVKIGSLRLDTAERKAYLDGTPLKLSAASYAVLRKLAEHPHKVQSLPELSTSRYVLYRLRALLGDKFIFNQPGRGWSLLP